MLSIFSVAAKDYPMLAQTAAAHGTDLIVTAAGLPQDLPKYIADYPDVALVPAVYVPLPRC